MRTTQSLATHRFQVGAVSVERVVESEGPLLAPGELYPNAAPADIADNLHWLAPRFFDAATRLFIITIQGFVLTSGGKTILVDTCVGDCKDRRRPQFHRQQWNWLGRLQAAGRRPEDIDIVVCTHLHTDHVGWNTRLVSGRWVPTFPRARYLFAKREWEFWWSERGRPGRERTGDYMVDSVLPVQEAGLADFVAMDHVLSEEVALLPAPGHTPGHVCVSIRSRGSEAVLLGDLLHTPLQCTHPQWSTRFCSDPEEASRRRRAFLERYADTATLVVPAHFPSPSAGHLKRAGGAFRFVYGE